MAGMQRNQGLPDQRVSAAVTEYTALWPSEVMILEKVTPELVSHIWFPVRLSDLSQRSEFSQASRKSVLDRNASVIFPFLVQCFPGISVHHASFCKTYFNGA